jgi:plasmid stability protein
MAQLLVRNIDDALVKKLKRRAAAHGVSTEEEHRRILREALSRPAKRKPSLIEFLLADEHAVHPETDLDLHRSRKDDSRDPGF